MSGGKRGFARGGFVDPNVLEVHTYGGLLPFVPDDGSDPPSPPGLCLTPKYRVGFMGSRRLVSVQYFVTCLCFILLWCNLC